MLEMDNKKKSVLVVINLFSSAQNFIGEQFKYLTEQGYDMHLICSPGKGDIEFVNKQGIKYYPLQLNRQLTPWQDLLSFIKIVKYIRKYKIDIVIGHQVKGRLLATIASKIARAPRTVIFAHGAVFETAQGLKRKLLIAESKLESKLSHKVVCVSDYIKELRLALKIDQPSQQYILGAGTCGGIDTFNRFNIDLINHGELNILKQRYGIHETDFIIGFVGRLVKDKGVIELIESFKNLKLHYPEKSIKLMIIGPIEKRDTLPSTVLEILQKSEDVIYTGKIPLEKMPIQYCCMDCLVLPSHRDGFGLCNIEAQAMGIPVITSSITGCRDSIKNQETGLYIDLTPEDISNKISMLFDDKLRLKLGTNGRKWVKDNFDHSKIWPFVKQMLEELYNE